MARHVDAERRSRRQSDRRSGAADARVDKRKRRGYPLWAKLCLAVGVVLTLLSTGVLGTAYALTARYDHNIKRQNLLGTKDGAAPEQVAEAKGPMNILVIGSDSRATEIANSGDRSSTTATVAGQRSDTIMLFHLSPGLDKGYAISIPRDTYVHIPPAKDWDGGKNKINAAYAFGGAPLLVKVVQQFTGLTVNHVVVVDFAAVRKITDAVSGVDVTVEKTTKDPRSKRTFTAGVNHLDGAAAEDYVRQRYGLPDGDFDRVKRQQQFIHALMSKVVESGALKDPAQLDKLLLAVTSALTVDSTFPVKALAFTLKARGFGPSSVQYITVPIADGRIIPGPGWVAIPDEEKTHELFASVKNETTDQYLLANPPNDATRGA